MPYSRDALAHVKTSNEGLMTQGTKMKVLEAAEFYVRHLQREADTAHGNGNLLLESTLQKRIREYKAAIGEESK